MRQEGTCELIMLTGTTEDAYILEDQIIVSRPVTIQVRRVHGVQARTKRSGNGDRTGHTELRARCSHTNQYSEFDVSLTFSYLACMYLDALCCVCRATRSYSRRSMRPRHCAASSSRLACSLVYMGHIYVSQTTCCVAHGYNECALLS